MHVRVAFFVASALVALSSTAYADEAMTIGQTEYLNSCAQCHGPTGKGDGVMQGVLKSGAPDITTLQQANGGVFPVSAVYKIIAGEGMAGAHGSAEMPAWGFRYSLKAPSMLGPYYTKEDAQAFVQGRILALVEYISTLQEK